MIWRATVSQRQRLVKARTPDWRRSRSSLITTTSALEKRFVQFDRAVTQPRVERVPSEECEIRVLNILNEHGPEPNVFWIPRTGIGCAALAL